MIAERSDSSAANPAEASVGTVAPIAAGGSALAPAIVMAPASKSAHEIRHAKLGRPAYWRFPGGVAPATKRRSVWRRIEGCVAGA